MQIYSAYNAWLAGVLYVLAYAAAPLYGQSWQSLYTWGAVGNESVEAVVHRRDGAYWVGGGFQGKVQVGSRIWGAWGEAQARCTWPDGYLVDAWQEGYFLWHQVRR